MTHPSPEQDRLWELLADEALFGLTEHEQAELQELCREHASLEGDAGFQRESLELTAAAAQIGRLSAPPEELPDRLRQRIKDQYDQGQWRDESQSTQISVEELPETIISEAQPTAKPQVEKNSGLPAWAGWAAAAACLLFAVGAWTYRIQTQVGPSQLRSELLADAGDLVQVPWMAGDDPAANGAGGDVIWSPSRQKGVMRIRGLAANDPTQQQYQLWLFDPQRKHPVDGGVFNIPAGASEVDIAIDPKLLVHKIDLFAITVEPPGGVVVSEKERVPLTATVAQD